MELPINLLCLHKLCAEESTKYEITSVSLSCDGTTACAVATDAKRLVAVEWPCAEMIAECFVPASSFAVLERIFGKRHDFDTLGLDVIRDDKTVNLCLTTRKERVTVTTATASPLGTFPPWRDILPKGEPEPTSKPWAIPDVDPELFAGLLDTVSGIMGRRGDKRITVFESKAGGPLYVKREDSVTGQVIHAAIMPLS